MDQFNGRLVKLSVLVTETHFCFCQLTRLEDVNNSYTYIYQAKKLICISVFSLVDMNYVKLFPGPLSQVRTVQV